MNFVYGEEYYTQANYAGYLEREERYERLAQELDAELFRVLKLDFKSKPILDYGCGVGFVVKAFHDLGYNSIFGYDISEWAINRARQNYTGLAFTNKKHVLSYYRWELMTSFDVFEHMPLNEVRDVLGGAKPKHLLVRIPLTFDDGGKFVLNVSENDPTHITRLTRESWCDFLKSVGYAWLFNVNLGTFYDTKGVMCAMFRAD
jgi:SAM-dependent methyltransferase